MADDGLCLPDDVLVNILLLLTPASSRRPLRLVCSRWRDLIDERAPPPPEERIPVRILVFVTQRGSSTALVFDDNDGSRAHLWTFTSSSEDRGSIHMVGTCNGLLCLHDHSSYGGSTSSAITVTNPITGETVALPPVPTPQFTNATGNYSFGFHPETKQHKVVYIPRGRRRSSADALRVFTLGGDTAAWREVPVPVPGACYELPCEPVSVGGCTYWLAESAGRVMALDLKDERVTSVGVPPAMGPPAPILAAARARWRLTNADGRLGVVVSASMPQQLSRRRVEVWVLEPEEGGGGDDEKQKPRWSQRYCVVEKTSKFWIMAPQLMHGDYVLSASQDPRRGTTQLYRHKVGDLMDGDGDGGEIIEQLNCELTTFAYFETKNPVPRSKWLAGEAELQSKDTR